MSTKQQKLQLIASIFDRMVAKYNAEMREDYMDWAVLKDCMTETKAIETDNWSTHVVIFWFDGDGFDNFQQSRSRNDWAYARMMEADAAVKRIDPSLEIHEDHCAWRVYL